MGVPLLLLLLLAGKGVPATISVGLRKHTLPQLSICKRDPSPQGAIVVSTDALLGEQTLRQGQESDAKA